MRTITVIAISLVLGIAWTSAVAPVLGAGCGSAAAIVKSDVQRLESCSVADATTIATASLKLTFDVSAMVAPGSDRSALAFDVMLQLSAIHGAWGRCAVPLPTPPTATQPPAKT